MEKWVGGMMCVYKLWVLLAQAELTPPDMIYYPHLFNPQGWERYV